MNTLVEFLGIVNDLAGFASLVVSIMVWVKIRAMDRLNERVEILLKLEDREQAITLPLWLLRRDVTRAEILGRIGMLPMKEKGKRFSIRHLSTPEFFQSLNEVIANKADTLVIPCSQEEINQFDL